MTLRGWGEVFLYFHIYLGSEHYFGSKFQKSNNFGSMKICGYLGGGGHYEIRLFFWGGGGRGSLLYILGLFKIKIQNGNNFLGRKFQIFCIYIYFFFLLGMGVTFVGDFCFGKIALSSLFSVE